MVSVPFVHWIIFVCNNYVAWGVDDVYCMMEGMPVSPNLSGFQFQWQINDSSWFFFVVLYYFILMENKFVVSCVLFFVIPWQMTVLSLYLYLYFAYVYAIMMFYTMTDLFICLATTGSNWSTHIDRFGDLLNYKYSLKKNVSRSYALWLQ